jgi:hypothetical protein
MSRFSELFLILFLSTAICSAPLHAQSKDTSGIKKDNAAFLEDKSVKNEIGFDMIFFLNLFRQNYEPVPATLFSFNYNRELTDNYSFRSTIGLGYTNYSIKTDTMPSLKNLIVQEDLKFGLAMKKGYKRWTLYFGADWEFQHGYTKEQSSGPVTNVVSITENTTKVFMTGPGPFCGLIFFINPRVSLNIEANANFLYSHSTDQTTNALHDELNSKREIKGFTTVYNIPQTLFLNFKF